MKALPEISWTGIDFGVSVWVNHRLLAKAEPKICQPWLDAATRKGTIYGRHRTHIPSVVAQACGHAHLLHLLTSEDGTWRPSGLAAPIASGVGGSTDTRTRSWDPTRGGRI